MTEHRQFQLVSEVSGKITFHLFVLKKLSHKNKSHEIKRNSAPVPISKFVSVLGQYKCNSSSLLNHRLVHVTFSLVRLAFSLILQWSDLRQVRKKVTCGERTHYLVLARRLFNLLLHHDGCKLDVYAVSINLKDANFKQKCEQNILHGRLALTIAQY